MEAASRPPLELLPDPPAEPTDVAAARKEPSSPSLAAAPAKAPVTAPKDPSQTGLNFVDPEMFLAPGEQASAVPVGNTDDTAAKPDPGLELVLEDPVVDEVLTAPPPPAPPAAPTAPLATAASSAKAATESTGNPAAVRAAARVPLARTASLAAAATKLAAASAAHQRSATKPRPTATATPAVRSATSASPATPSAPAPAKTTAQPAAKVEAPSLASWASARAAVAAPKAATPAPAPAPAAAPKSAPPKSAALARPAPAAVAPVPAPPAPPASAATGAPAPTPLPVSPTMDRDFIARNQVVERYLSGRLPIKSATDFERFCRDHPELLDEIGLPDKVNAGLRLLEASGKPEPWQEASSPMWQRPPVTLALAAAVAVLTIALAVVGGGSAGKSHRIADLQKQASERALDPATSTREIRLLPSRTGASNAPAITIGGVGTTQLAELKIDESRSPYHAFRVTIDRIDQGRVSVINNLGKDSNGHLRIALNTSALGPGNYLFTLEGLDWRGAAQPDSWVTIGIQH
jgi:hypothetical protein